MAELRLVRDVLDQQIIDREARKVGKVDGIVVELLDDGRARVLYLEVGNAVLARRVSDRLGRLYERIRKRLLDHPTPPFRISWKKVRKIDLAVHADIEASSSDAYRLERWLRDHLIAPIPGSSHGKEKKSR